MLRNRIHRLLGPQPGSSCRSAVIFSVARGMSYRKNWTCQRLLGCCSSNTGMECNANIEAILIVRWTAFSGSTEKALSWRGREDLRGIAQAFQKSLSHRIGRGIGTLISRR